MFCSRGTKERSTGSYQGSNVLSMPLNRFPIWSLFFFFFDSSEPATSEAAAPSVVDWLCMSDGTGRAISVAVTCHWWTIVIHR